MFSVTLDLDFLVLVAVNYLSAVKFKSADPHSLPLSFQGTWQRAPSAVEVSDVVGE